jgi:hypothetical protein
VLLAALLLNPTFPLCPTGDLISPMLILQLVILLAGGPHQLKGGFVVLTHLSGDVVIHQFLFNR